MEPDYSNIRLPPSSSELVALSTLTPPSPVLRPALSSSSVTSGEIPILLDSSLDFSAGDIISQRFSIATRSSTLGDTGARRASTTGSLFEGHLFQLESSTSFASVGTFGPVCRSQAQGSANKRVSHNLPSEDAIPRAAAAAAFPCFRDYATRIPELSEPPPTKALNFNDENAPSTSPVLLQTQSQVQTQQGNYSGQAITSTNTTTSSCEDSATSFSGAEITTTRTHGARGLEARSLPSPSGRDKLQDTSSNFNGNPVKATVEPCLKQPVQSGSPGRKPKLSPSSLLDKTRVLLSIDQEGFRSINPSFKFVGFAMQTVGDKQQRKENMAQFVPQVNHQVFHFHYAPFDGLPVLRRISVNDDENYDYMSREATLGIKSNGLYVVHGIELAMQSAHDERSRGHAELYWEFVYKVDNRRVGPSNKLVGGEKNFTPISFSCSPALLHPSQRKRFNFIHVMKKSITARLTAEKVVHHLSELELRPENHLSSRVTSTRRPLHDATNTTPGMHRRALTHGRQEELSAASGVIEAFPHKSSLQENRSGARTHDIGKYPRRRASSAGEWKGHDCRRPRTEVKTHTLTRYPPIQKHIVHPTRLARMLEADNDDERGSHQVAQPDFLPLGSGSRHCRSRGNGEVN